MTNTTPARQAIRWTADANGWTWAPKGIRFDQYSRGPIVITVEFIQSSGVTREGRRFNGVTSVLTPSRGKRETVLGWLMEDAAVADAMAASVELDESRRGADRAEDATDAQRDQDAAMLELAGDSESATIPTVDEVAAAVTDPAWGREAAADTIERSSRGLGLDAQAARIVELERELGVARRAYAIQAQDYRTARARIAELEDAPIRARARRLVEALTDMRGPNGEPVVSLSVSRAWGALADALGIDTSRPLAVAPEPARPVSPSRALQDLGIAVRPSLPGERVAVREVMRALGQPLPVQRVIGSLTDDVLRTDEGREAREIQVEHVPAYVAAVRRLGRPTPAARRLVVAQLVGQAQRLTDDAGVLRATHRGPVEPTGMHDQDAERAAAYVAQSTQTCDHGRLLWQSCNQCGVPAWVPPVEVNLGDHPAGDDGGPLDPSSR